MFSNLYSTKQYPGNSGTGEMEQDWLGEVDLARTGNMEIGFYLQKKRRYKIFVPAWFCRVELKWLNSCRPAWARFFLLNYFDFICLFTVAALECPDCISYPVPGQKSCDSKPVPTITCGPEFDRCMTVEGKIKGQEMTFVYKNCSNSVLCDPDDPYYSK